MFLFNFFCCQKAKLLILIFENQSKDKKIFCNFTRGKTDTPMTVVPQARDKAGH